MDPQPNAEHDPKSVNTPDNATTSENEGDAATEPSPRGWLRENAVSLLVAIAGCVVVGVYLNPLDVILAVLGLGGIVFLHELGHFLAAKACDVHITAFAIGFGPALPFCSFRYGETRYKIGLIPLGGYVAMVGEGEPGTVEGENARTDPRSFKNKSVFQRMFVISAGVIMNLLLGGICFITAYMHGVEEQPAIASTVDPGSAAWRAGIRPGEHVRTLNGMQNIWFDDIRPTVSGTSRGEIVHLETEYRGEKRTYDIEPLRVEGALYPQLGLAGPSSVTLFQLRRDAAPPVMPGSAAALAVGSDGRGFLPGDRLIATSDPDHPEKMLTLESPRAGFVNEHLDLQDRLVRLAGRPVRIQLHRKNAISPVDITLPATHRRTTGMWMKMGPITAIRTGSSAEKAGIKAQKKDGDNLIETGSVIVGLELPEPNGKSSTRLKSFDPLRLPFELNAWADRWGGKPAAPVKLTLLQDGQTVIHELNWDDSYREHFAFLSTPGSPVPLGGLGLAYTVLSTVDFVEAGSPAEAAGIQPGDRVKQVRIVSISPEGKDLPGKFEDVGDAHWAYVETRFHAQPPYKIEIRYERGSEQTAPLIIATEDKTWPVPADGFLFMKELQTQRAESLGEALQMGTRRTIRAIKSTYQGLYGMVFGRISVKLISGPGTLAEAAYRLAGEDIWKLVILVALISINLAVVNFLPIPVLDGGHMVFLIYEWVRRKPPPEMLHTILTFIGLAIVLSMMLFAVGLDIWRKF